MTRLPSFETPSPKPEEGHRSSGYCSGTWPYVAPHTHRPGHRVVVVASIFASIHRNDPPHPTGRATTGRGNGRGDSARKERTYVL